MKLAKKEQRELLSLIERKTAAQRDVMRARIALWAHEGHSNTFIARGLGVSVQTVCLWRKRIVQQGVQGIREGEHGGRPAHITHEERLQIVALACETQEPEGRVTPTLDEIVARAVERGVVGQISRSQVQRILQAGHVHGGTRPISQQLLVPERTLARCMHSIASVRTAGLDEKRSLPPIGGGGRSWPNAAGRP